jgi:molecular chaperone GrpE
MEKKLKECQQQRDEYLAGWQRSRADFLNYKKEEEKRMNELLKYANQGLILKMLSVLDNFEKASQAIPQDKKDKHLEGLLQIKTQMKNLFKSLGLEEIKSLGEKFDPNLHESVEGIEGEKSGIIVEEIQKGYKLNGRVIRPAKVKINK